ncbi:MAG: hypothetical protein NTZ50_14040 [Chloroflexi bacterium]|nr:hypothetical protein [Chloroflexota bacterium]
MKKSAQSPAPLLLVLDDAHAAASPESSALIQLLIDGAHDRFRLILVARSLHTLSLPANSLVLDAADLRLTPATAAMLTNLPAAECLHLLRQAVTPFLPLRVKY